MEKILKIHPDALYDSEYIDYVLETDDFAAPELALKGEYKHEKGVTVITTSGREIIIENCFDNTLRLRITQPGACVDKTVTERLGLIKTDWAAAPYDYELKDGVITFSNARLTLVFDMNTNEYEFRTKGGKTLLKTKNGGARVSSVSADYSGVRTYTEFERIGEEKYSGFGARIYKVDRTGESADIFAEVCICHGYEIRLAAVVAAEEAVFNLTLTLCQRFRDKSTSALITPHCIFQHDTRFVFLGFSAHTAPFPVVICTKNVYFLRPMFCTFSRLLLP